MASASESTLLEKLTKMHCYGYDNAMPLICQMP